MSSSINRNFGLDIVRSIAIILVLICHAGTADYVFYNFGFYGVELFFVLSGFLIGQIIIKEFSKDKSYKSLLKFWIKRWLRTLPLYFLVLITLNIIYSSEIFRWKHYIFIQNFDLSQVGWFGVSWSLSIEEWFYLFVPLILIILPPYFIRNKKWLSILILFLIFLIVCIRFIYVLKYNPEYDNGIRKFIPLRLDSLLVGVFLANLKINYQAIFQKISNWKIALIVLLSIVR